MRRMKHSTLDIVHYLISRRHSVLVEQLWLARSNHLYAQLVVQQLAPQNVMMFLFRVKASVSS